MAYIKNIIVALLYILHERTRNRIQSAMNILFQFQGYKEVYTFLRDVICLTINVLGTEIKKLY